MMLTGRKFVSIVKPKRLLTQMNRPNRKGFILIPFQFQIGTNICMYEVHSTISLKLARSLPILGPDHLLPLLIYNEHYRKKLNVSGMIANDPSRILYLVLGHFKFVDNV